MREILFRGKRSDGIWVYGYYFAKPILNLSFIICGEEQWSVDPDTVGQCPGLADKKGARIFEGDIVRHNDGSLHEVVFERRNGHAYFGWKMNERETWNFDSGFLRQLEVVGNIHDNPELIEG